jgi:hypothetical protein
MAFTKCAGPAHPCEDDGEARRDRLGSKISSPNTPSPAQLQAPDDRGESDLDFFVARPSHNERVRLPFPNEFPPGVLEPGRGAFIHVYLASRDPVTNAPGIRARAIIYSDEGGRA